MDLIRELDETSRNHNPHPIVFRGLHVPFPELDHEDDNDDNDREHHHRGHQRLNQPSDSETGDSTAHRSSSSSTTTTTATSANMESSTSSTTLSESLQGESVQDDIVRRPLRPAADCPGNETTHDIKLPPSQCPQSTTTTPPPQRRISFQDEMQSIDISSVSDPVSCIKRILDGLVSELKEQCGGSERRQDKKTKEVVVSAVLERHAAKRARTAHGCAEEEEEGAGDATPDSSSDANAREQQQRQQQPQQTTIQTIMNWMDTFQDSEPVQLTCLQSLPSLLEHNTLRYHAQMEGLASIVLYDMAAFQENFLLQLTAFHTLVVLLRPLGAMEGTLVRTGGTTGRGAVHRMDTPNSTVKGGEGALTKNGVDTVLKTEGNTIPPRRDGVKPVSSILSNTPMMSTPPSLPLWEENGVRVMLDVLRLYSHDRYLQAMGCWAMVNAALYPTLKKSLLKLGGVYVVTNAMMLHPSAEAVQFRGLFALINLVIPDGDADATSIHCHIYQIARLTILAMKNFHANKSILNRGCLVLRNLSLTPSHVAVLARTPGCVDMLLHCRQACPKDLLVQRSARTIMILMQRVTDRQMMWSGANTGTSSEVQTGGSGLGETSSTADAGSSASAPCVPRKEECGKRSRSSCSW